MRTGRPVAERVVDGLLEDGGERFKQRLVLGITLEYPEQMDTADVIRQFLDGIPERYGPVVLHDLRIVRGNVDADGVQIAGDGKPYGLQP